MKFGRYLAENQTPEWKRAYIDYRACKKAIKVVGTRLGQVKDRSIHLGNGDGNDADADGDADKDGDSSSGADDDHGPSAPPKKSLSGSLRSRQSVKSPVITTGQSQGGTPHLGKFPSRLSEARTPQSPHYGSTGLSPRPFNRQALIPPPLDLGEAHSQLDENQDLPNLATASSSGGNGYNEDATKSRKGQVTFNPQSQSVNNPSEPHSQDETPEGSRGSSEDSQNNLSDSNKPLCKVSSTQGQGQGQANLTPKVFGKSPRFPFSPRTGGSPRVSIPETPQASDSPKPAEAPKIGKSPGQTPRTFRGSPLLNRIKSSGGTTVRAPETFEELYSTLEPDEKAFFDLLEHELDKVEKFYSAREREAVRRAHDLRDQLRELAEHRKLYHELYPEGMPEWEAKVGRLLPNSIATGAQQVRVPAFSELRERLKYVFNDEGFDNAKNGVHEEEHGHRDRSNSDPRSRSPVMAEDDRRKLREAMAADKDHQTYSPERYQKYKKELRTAVLEFYRQLELIKNYRIMNLTGFRKALKKFEKTTKIHCMEMYTDEKIAAATFSKGDIIEGQIKQVEELYTIHFEHGDSKKARDKLRRQNMEQTHYTTVFRSGIMLGLAIPAAIVALAESSRAETRAAIPAWGGLLQVYAGLFLPVIFAMLFELNLGAYVATRINYEFVMELTKPTIDYRSFLEIPAFLFLTLSYCFYFSFAQIGTGTVASTTWPAAWLVFVVAFFLNPLPVLRRGSRYWLLRVLFRVLTPGYSKVEFIAFFVADELNSLIYSTQNIYFLSCAYSKGWPGNVFDVCHSGKTWPYAVLLCVPALCRLIQCLKRWHDSRLNIHLINAGKYASVITQQCLFTYWRSQGSQSKGASFIVWVLFATASAAYACSWDLIVDWSLLRPNAGLLRKDLGYSRRYVYYFAMVTNFLIRFVFVWYIPDSQSHVRIRSFFFALAEMLRRWQWNFFRVETEHLGNADAYRVTREVPLPYRRANDSSEDDDGGGSLNREKSISLSRTRSIQAQGQGSTGKGLNLRLSKLKNRFSSHGNSHSNTKGRGPDALDVGARGHAKQREYEARRPGDETQSQSSPTPISPANGERSGTESV